jgi:hypothetical protein
MSGGRITMQQELDLASPRTLMERVAALEKRVEFLEKITTNIHGRFYTQQEAAKDRDEPASE